VRSPTHCCGSGIHIAYGDPDYGQRKSLFRDTALRLIHTSTDDGHEDPEAQPQPFTTEQEELTLFRLRIQPINATSSVVGGIT